MADDKDHTYNFPERERNFNDSLGRVIGRFCISCVEADSAAKDKYIERIAELSKMENLTSEAEVSIVGMKEKLTASMNYPVLTVAPTRPFEIEKALISMDMTTSSTESDSSSVASKSAGKGTAKIGWGPLSVGISVSASVSTSKEHKRSSDYRATTHAEVTMVQGEVPEGVALIVEAMNGVMATGLEINKMLINKQAAKMAEEAGGAAAPAPAG